MQKLRVALIVLLVAIVPLSILGAAWVYFRAASVPEAPKVAAPPPKPRPVVLTASTDLPVGRLINATDILWSPLQNGAVLQGHMVKGQTKPDTVIGAVVRRGLQEGTPLTWSAIVRPGQYGFLAAALKPDHRAVTIPVDEATSQAGLIYPGDRVDVILTVEVQEGDTNRTSSYAGTFLEDIRVVAVNRQVQGSPAAQEQPSGPNSRNKNSTVTVEVLPAEAERLVMATSKGEISLAMRSLTGDRVRGKLTAAAFEDLLSLPARFEPAAAAPEPVAAPEPPPDEPGEEMVTVKIFRGAERHEVTLEK